MRNELINFSKNMQTYMEYYRLTQTDLANSLNVSQASVSKWVLGTAFPRINKIDEMCNIFHCSRSDLIEREQTTITIQRKIKLNKLMSQIDTLNDDGIDKTISFIQDLSERYKVK